MNNFDIKAFLDNTKKNGESRIVAIDLERKDGGREMVTFGHGEIDFLNSTLGKSPSSYPSIVEVNSKDAPTIKLVYGQYRPTYSDLRDQPLITENLKRLLCKPLVTIDSGTDHYYAVKFKVLDYKLVEDQVIAYCSHCEDPHETNYVAFALLVEIHQDLQIGDLSYGCQIAFHADPDMDVVGNFYNREGLIVLDLEESELDSTRLNANNWLTSIKLDKAKLVSKYI